MYTLAAADTIQAVAGTTTAITYTIDGMEYSVALGEVYKVLGQGQVATGVAAIYTAPASTVAFISEIRLVNTTGSLVSGIIIYRGGTAASNQITGSFSIPAGGTALISFPGGMEICDNLGNLYTTGTNVFDTTAVPDTTPLADSTAGSALIAAHRDHTHQSPGGIAAITASSGAIANTETQIAVATLPANFCAAGTTFRICASGVGTTSTSPGSSTFRIRIGTTTLTGNIAASVTAAGVASVSTQAFWLEALITVRSNGAGGSVIGEMIVSCNSVSTGLFTSLNNQSVTTATVALDTTAQKLIELTYVSGAASSSCTFHNASIEVVKM